MCGVRLVVYITIGGYLFRCDLAAGQVIDKKDGINTIGFYIQLGTAQVMFIISPKLLTVLKLVQFIVLGCFKSFVRFCESTLNCNIPVNTYQI